MYQQHVSHYKRQEIQTASPGKLIIMLYDGALRNLNAAEHAYEAEDYERKAQALSKAQDIVMELMNALNLEQGGVIAKNLESLYVYVLQRLLDADTNKNLRALRETREILSELRDAYASIVNRNETVNASR